ncbi:MAG: mannitol dehydrogenase family protein [Actinomycetota bacterium]|nr:mannitol dehydrogenase family protein [Actinomycetota bacterium]
MTRRLGFGALDELPASVGPQVDPRSVSVGIVHLGIGAFHRAHQAVFTEAAMAATGDLGWGVCGVSQRSRTVVDQLAPQDGLYAVLERSAAGASARVVGAVREVVCATDDVASVLARIAAPSTHVLTLTVTEKGYRLRPATGRLDLADPEVVADLVGRPPRTVVGQVVRGLERRMRADAGPITVVCCDNLPANGSVLRRLVGDFCDRLPDSPGLAGWIAQFVRFPATMVDRIVPVAVEADRTEVTRVLGLRDEGTVVAEPFRQWVIEDDFAGARPTWERAGATLTDDVAPYETMKLRLLNGSHSALAYLGGLAGCEFIANAVRTAGLGELVHRLMAEVRPTLPVPAGFDVTDYSAVLLDRFANPALRHRTVQVAMDGSQKLPQRLLATARDLLADGASPRLTAFAVAGWMRYVTAGHNEGGSPLPVDDPMAVRIAAVTAGTDSPRAVCGALLGLTEIFGDDLSGDPVFAGLVLDGLERLTGNGVAKAVRGVLGS